MYYFLRAVEKFGDVHAYDGRRHQAEIRERRIAAADAGQAEENVPEAVGLRHLLHLRTGIGNGDETFAIAPGALKEILLENIRLERAPRFAGNNKQRLLQIDTGLNRPDLCRVSGIEHVEARETPA